MGSVTCISEKPQFQTGLLLLLLAVVGTRVGCEFDVSLMRPERLEQALSLPISHSGQAMEPADTTAAAKESAEPQETVIPGAQESVTRVTEPSSTELETSSQDLSTSNHDPLCSSSSGTSVTICSICFDHIIERPASTTAHEQPVTADIENQSTSSNGGQVGNEHVVTVSNHQYPSILTRTDETSHKIPDPNAMVQLVCSHLFHEKCIVDWFTKNTDQPCPICRGTGTLAIPDPTFSNWFRQMRERARRIIITPVANRYILFEQPLILAMMGTTMDQVLSENQILRRFRHTRRHFRQILTLVSSLLVVFLMILKLTSISPAGKPKSASSLYDVRGPSDFPF